MEGISGCCALFLFAILAAVLAWWFWGKNQRRQTGPDADSPLNRTRPGEGPLPYESEEAAPTAEAGEEPPPEASTGGDDARPQA